MIRIEWLEKKSAFFLPFHRILTARGTKRTGNEVVDDDTRLELDLFNQ